MELTTTEKSIVLAAYFRGMAEEADCWTSNCDQVVTLSLFYTGDLSFDECARRFSVRSYVLSLYRKDGKLKKVIEARYRILIRMLGEHPELIEGGGDFETPAYPTFTACRLKDAGVKLATSLINQFLQKPDFSNWPDKRAVPKYQRRCAPTIDQ